MCIFDDSHNGRKRHSTFVQRLNEVGKDHDSENALVYEALQAFVGSFVNFNNGLARILGNLLINEFIVHMRLLEILILDDLGLIEVNAFNDLGISFDIDCFGFRHPFGRKAMLLCGAWRDF